VRNKARRESLTADFRSTVANIIFLQMVSDAYRTISDRPLAVDKESFRKPPAGTKNKETRDMRKAMMRLKGYSRDQNDDIPFRYRFNDRCPACRSQTYFSRRNRDRKRPLSRLRAATQRACPIGATASCGLVCTNVSGEQTPLIAPGLEFARRYVVRSRQRAVNGFVDAIDDCLAIGDASLRRRVGRVLGEIIQPGSGAKP
jgi:hypothetical protein